MRTIPALALLAAAASIPFDPAEVEPPTSGAMTQPLTSPNGKHSAPALPAFNPETDEVLHPGAWPKRRGIPEPGTEVVYDDEHQTRGTVLGYDGSDMPIVLFDDRPDPEATSPWNLRYADALPADFLHAPLSPSPREPSTKGTYLETHYFGRADRRRAERAQVQAKKAQVGLARAIIRARAHEMGVPDPLTIPASPGRPDMAPGDLSLGAPQNQWVTWMTEDIADFLGKTQPAVRGMRRRGKLDELPVITPEGAKGPIVYGPEPWQVVRLRAIKQRTQHLLPAGFPKFQSLVD